MAWKYRKRIKIAPGVNINFSKSGVSTTIGPRGANINVGNMGTYINTGIPGTGLYNRQRLNGSTSVNSSEDTSGGCVKVGIGIILIFLAFILLTSSCIGGSPSVISIIIVVGFAISGVILLMSAHNSNVNETTETNRINEAPINYAAPSELPQERYCGKYDPLFEEAAKLLVTAQVGSTSLIQRTFSIGYVRAGKIMDELEEQKIIGHSNGKMPREVLVKDESDLLLITSKMVLEWTQRETSTKETAVDRKNGLTEEQFDLIKNEASALNEFIAVATRKRNVRKELDQMLQLVNSDDTPWSVSDKIRCAIMADVYRCFKGLGHNFGDDDDDENIGMYLFMSKYLNTGEIPYSSRTRLKYTVKDSIKDVLETSDMLNKSAKMQANEFFLQKALGGYDKDMQSQYMVHLYRFASAIANADGEISEDEEKWLADIMKSKDHIPTDGSNVIKTDNYETKDASENPYEDLNDLIGLSSVKEEITKLTNFIKIQKVREDKGLKTSSVSYHCVFTGNPGTGKTTVARIIASIYKELGVLKKGQLIETDRSGLVAEYVGQTAVKTNKIIDSALDGVLFIDEAYSLVQGAKEDYGNEAISTLLKRMEDNRDRLVVILAGYGNEMKDFIDSNPGLQSRFNRYIHFPDYDVEELLSIYKRNLQKHQYTINEDAEAYLRSVLENAIANKDKNFGNARFVRNMFEKTLENQAMRLAATNEQLTSDILCKITIEDIKAL